MPQAKFAFVLPLSALLLVQCTTPAVQVRNPFREETEFFQRMIAKSKLPPEERAAQSPPAAPDAPPSAQFHYFGTREPGARRDPQPRTATPSPAETEPIENPEPRRSQGTPCYQCNGKGYRVNLSGPLEGETSVCPVCRGAGRL